MINSKIKKYSSVNADNIAENFMGRPVKWVTMLFLVVIVIFPLYWLVTNSIRIESDWMASPPNIVPAKVTFDNYVRIFSKGDVTKGLINSVIVTSVATFLSVLFGILASYSLVKGKLGKLRNLFAFWFLIQKMYPAIATAIPIYMVVRNMGLIDTKLSLIVINTSFSLPLVIWLMMGFFQEIPESIEESGIIDGCSMTQRLFHLVIPIAKTGIIASTILTFVNVWNEFLFAVILTVRDAKTLPVIISSYITDRGLDWGPMTAIGVVIILPVLILVWTMQKNFVKGLVMGSVKG